MQLAKNLCVFSLIFITTSSVMVIAGFIFLLGIISTSMVALNIKSLL